MEIILASKSPRRARLLQLLDVEFRVDPSGIREITDPSLAPGQLVESLARQKGEDVAQRHQSSLIIAADTIVWFDGRALGKPASARDAREMLQSLSNQTHEVYSGVYLAELDQTGQIQTHITFHERTNVRFSALGDQEIEHYIKSGSPMDKAGSYGIQDDFGSFFVASIEGDYNNVVGFPLHAFYRKLQTCMPHIHQTIFFNHS